MTPKQTQQNKMLTRAHHTHARGMILYSLFKTHDQATSDDLVQETFLKTWRYLVRGGDIIIMKAFLYHTLNHLIIDEYRKRKTLSLEALMEKGYEPHIDFSHRQLNALDGKVALLLIKRLPPKYRTVMRMRYAQDLSIKEIALLTGQSRNTVAVQAHRGLAKLRLLYHRARK